MSATAVRLLAQARPSTRRQSAPHSFPPPDRTPLLSSTRQAQSLASSSAPGVRHSWPLDCACLLLFALCLRLFTFGRAHWTSPDEYFYAVMARDFSNLFSDPGYLAQLRNVDTLHAPGFALALSVVSFFTNDPSIEVGRYFGLTLNALTIPVTYALVMAIGYSRAHAFFAAFALAIVPGFWKDADRVWLDHQATLLVTAFWAAAIWAWRTRVLTRWASACALLVAVLFTKEYLLALIGVAVPFGLLEPIRARDWKFARRGSAMMIATTLCGLYALVWSGWMPPARYVTQFFRPAERGSEYRTRHPMTKPDWQKLYYKNSEESDLPALFWMLALAGGARAALDAARRPERLAALAALGVFSLALALFISMMPMEFGARLLFPAYPIACAFISIALLEVSLPLVPVIVPLLAVAIWQRSIRSFLEQMHGAAFFWEVIAIVSVLFLVAFLTHRLAKDDRSRRATHRLATAITLLLMLVMSATCVAGSARNYRHQVVAMGEQSGLVALAPTLRRFVAPDDVILSPNPRELAYYLDMKFAAIDDQAWLDGTYHDAMKYTTPAELGQRRVKWVALMRPEFSSANLTAVRAALSQQPWFEEKFKYAIGRKLSFVIFRVYPEKFPTGAVMEHASPKPR